MIKDRGDIPYLDNVYDRVASMIVSYIVEDHMSHDDAVRLALSNEFNPHDIDSTRVMNVIRRTSMLVNIQNEDPVKELSR
jgi:hypothetical protein